MSELPEGWVEATFDDVAVVVANLVDPADYQTFPHIAPNHIESGSGRLLPYATVEGDGVKSPKHLFGPGQILYSKIRPYLAKAVLVDFTGLCSADMYPIDTALEPRFLFRWMLGSTFTEMASRSQGRTVLPKINKNALGVLHVPVPPLNEQKRIVAKIDALTAKSREARAALAEVPELLEKLRQSILAAAFRGDLTKKWREQNPDVEPATVLLERIRAERRKKWEENELAKFKAKGKRPTDDKWRTKYVEPEPVDTDGLPELPDGWCWASADQVREPDAEIVYGIVQPGPVVPGGVPYVRGKDIQDGRILERQLLTTHPDIARRYSRASLRGGDVLLGIIRATKVAIVPPSLEGANLTQGTARFRPSSIVGTEYLAGALENPVAQRWLQDHYRGIDMPGLNLKDVRKLPIPLAPPSEQAAVVRALELMLASARSAQSVTADLVRKVEDLDSSTLGKAFRGELVPQDPSDEPASVLLDRIRAEGEVGSAQTSRVRAKGRASTA